MGWGWQGQELGLLWLVPGARVWNNRALILARGCRRRGVWGERGLLHDLCAF